MTKEEYIQDLLGKIDEALMQEAKVRSKLRGLVKSLSRTVYNSNITKIKNI